MASNKRLGVGFIGSGFNTRFHIRSWVGVRDADVRGVWSPNAKHAEEAAALSRSLRVGDAKAFNSIEGMIADPSIDCIWLCGPNHMRIENMEAIVHAVTTGKGQLIGIACEKPLARNVGEAKRVVELVEKSGLLHGYLENQLFTPAIQRGRALIWARGAALTGRPYLARAAEEHSGPHMPWFWQGELQGGGVLNDMMCHSVEVARYLLTEPGKPRASIRPVAVSAQIASLKWSRPEYVERLKQMMGNVVDYAHKPSEDFARATVNYVDEQGHPIIVEATTSWSFVGAGLRLSQELRKLDKFAAVLIDDIGYVKQDRDEMEVLFTLLAERYERRSVMMTTNLVFSKWDQIFKDPMTTAAAVDRLVHHAVILELNLPSYRAEKALEKRKSTGEFEGGNSQ